MTRFQTLSSHYPLVLASSSPRRKRLLGQLGLPFRSIPTRVDENHGDEGPAALTRTLSEKKARASLPESKNHWVLGADTIVVLDEKKLGKPENPAEARTMLLQLSKRGHRVVTGFSLLDPEGHLAHVEAVTTAVTFKKLTSEEIERYIATGEPFGKAGSYGIQGIGAFMIEGISGSYTNVVGLPLCALIKALYATGALKSYPLTR